MNLPALEKTITPERMYHAFGELFPSEFEFLVLYHLYLNYPEAEIQYAEIKQAITDTSRLPFLQGKDKQVERTFKGLLRNFIERAPTKYNRFLLTLHARKVIEIVTQRIHNPYLKFPLKETFETYFKLPVNAGEDTTRLQSWFKFGFLNNAQQVVTGHLEGLKLSVDDAIKALNQILEADDLSAMQMLEQFSKNFQILGDKARQITEAIKMKVDVHYQLRDIVEVFTDTTSDKEGTSMDTATRHNNRRIALEIKEDVHRFFDKVDKQLDLINMKMVFASTKIKELQESLRAQSLYKISLKKLLVYLLENSKIDSQKRVQLPEKFPTKGLVLEKFRFRSIRYYDMGFLKKAKPIEQETDEAYEEGQRKLFEHELYKQAQIQQYCEQIGEELSVIKLVDLNAKLFEIMQQDDGIEIGIQTGYELIRNLSRDSHVEIEEELMSNESKSIHLWKTTIQEHLIS
ncbi:hypothetical protein [Pinibacter soli]|uniref:Uncharacterized protein n=1 Tax=Pinibacter soli TaxID=3044211 RepID=A0ABT6RFS1_9BACT|nr:hypothetical protein [Pinibacter soli]MDI3321410.1 hypothetical protein [Pinibacter soli]